MHMQSEGGAYKKERRKYQRFECDLDIMVMKIEGREINLPAKTKNFSRFGLCLIANDIDLNERDEIDLMIKLPIDKTFSPLKGEVIWKMDRGRQISAGILIKEINSRAKSEILEYAYDRWVNQQRVS